jgi:hypothetical protein
MESSAARTRLNCISLADPYMHRPVAPLSIISKLLVNGIKTK